MCVCVCAKLVHNTMLILQANFCLAIIYNIIHKQQTIPGICFKLRAPVYVKQFKFCFFTYTRKNKFHTIIDNDNER